MAGHSHITIPKGALYTVPDVEFMQGMIAHHAQAIHMARMAAAHHADARLLRLATKIGQSQVAEIHIMQEWLVRNGQAAPDTSSWRTMMMPGMLTSAQLEELDAATGSAFDHAFLTMMIQHHQGALQMVKDLLGRAWRRAGRGCERVRQRCRHRPDGRDWCDGADAFRKVDGRQSTVDDGWRLAGVLQ